MKKINGAIKVSLPVIFFIFISISCKRTEINYTNSVQIEKAKKRIEKEIQELGGIPQRIEVNQRLDMVYTDLNGNNISSSNLKKMSVASTCGDNLPDYFELSYYHRLYQCNLGYKVRFGFITSWNNNIVLVNPYNSANKTKGTVKISIPGNSNAYNETTYNVLIIDYGSDPNLPSNNIFLIQFETATPFAAELINMPGAVMRLGAYITSDCSSLDNYQIAPTTTSGFGFSTPLNDNPCTRNDKAWFLFPGETGYRQIGIFGYDPLGLCSYEPGAAPSLQETEYSLDNGTTWNDFINNSTPPINAYYGSKYVSKSTYALSATIPVGTYNIKIRYRNIKYNAGFSGTSFPSLSNACGTNTFDTPVWTVESFSNIVVN